MRQGPEEENPDIKVLRITIPCGTVHNEMPEITSKHQHLSILGDLHELCRHPPAEPYLVINLSRLKVIDISLVGILMSLTKELRGKGCDVTFAGLNVEMLPPDLRKKMNSMASRRRWAAC